MADLTNLQGSTPVEIINETSGFSANVDADSRLIVGDTPIHQIECEKKRLYGFMATVNMATATEIRLALIRNPAGSGKVMYLQRLTVLLTNTANSSGVIRAYLTPTVTTTGTAGTINNTNVGGGGAATVMQAFTSPTVSAVGTVAYATRVQGGDGAQPTEANFEGSIAINPGVDVLLTGLPDGTNREIIFIFLWLEK